MRFKESYLSLCEVNIQTESPVLVDWLLFLTNNIITDILKHKISRFIEDILVGLQWKMITLGTQGKIPKENPVRALHVYIDELNVNATKPQLLAVYTGNASTNHSFPLYIQMCLVPKIDSILNMQGWC